MKVTAYRRGLLVSTIIGSAMAVAMPMYAHAQEAEEPTAVQDIVVTGSRIARRDAVAESPIFTVQQEDLTHSGSTTVEHYLNTLPQVTASSSSQSNNPNANGRAYIDLRGLGNARNIVLMDGRRPMGSTSGGTVDVNTIPAALVDRVEIISGGAASTYGADAVSGVVNFILKNDFEGVQVDSQYRLTEQGDGEEWGTDITFGGRFGDGRGNAVFNASYFSREAMYRDARDFTAQAQNSTDTFPGGAAVIGDNLPDQARIDEIFGGANRCARSGGHAGFGFNPDGTLFCTGLGNSSVYNMYNYKGPQSELATNHTPNIYSYNFEPESILVLPMERWNLFSRVNYTVSESFNLYAQGTYTNYNAVSQLAATPASASTGWQVSVTNPFLDGQLREILAARPNPNAPFTFTKRFNDLGSRHSANTHDVMQLLVGTKGRIAGTDTWKYDAYASYGRSVLNNIQSGNVRRDRVGLLLGHIEPRRSGETEADYNARVLAFRAPTVAEQASLSDGKCKNGLDLFGRTPIDAECAAWISLEAKNLTTIVQSVVEFSADGDLFALPAGMVQGAFGAGYREMSYDFRPDSGLQPGLVAGFNQQLPSSGAQNWIDVFGEVLVPIVKDLPFAQDVSLSLGYRVSENSISGSHDSWKANLEWEVNDWMRLRGGMQTAIRSPSISELFDPQVGAFATFKDLDPCDVSLKPGDFTRSGPNGAKVAALCALQSAVAGGPDFTFAGQGTSITGGNPDLQPEQAESWTLGAVFNSPFNTGGWADTLYLSVDYWSIQLDDAIRSVTASTIVQRCFNRDNANPTFDPNNEWCKLFSRDQASGAVKDVSLLSRNQAMDRTSGVDIAFNARFDTDRMGSFGLNIQSTWLQEYVQQVTKADKPVDYRGTINNATASARPEWRHTITGSWALDPVSVQLSARYIDSMVHANTVTGGGNGTGVPEIWYFDLRGSYDINETVSVRAGINNLFDQDPPLYSPGAQGALDPSTYDVLGRRYFVGVTARF